MKENDWRAFITNQICAKTNCIEMAIYIQLFIQITYSDTILLHSVCISYEIYIHSELQTVHILKEAAMADELKAEYKRLQEKKRIKKDDALEVDEFEWIQVEKIALVIVLSFQSNNTNAVFIHLKLPS